MKLSEMYKEIIVKGIAEDIRTPQDISSMLVEKKRAYEKLDAKEKEFFDTDELCNPFSDTRILHGNGDADITSMIVGVDVEDGELLLVDRLNQKGKGINLVIAHHPEGRALVGLPGVMDLQIDAYIHEGLSASFSENTLRERQGLIERRLHSANTQRSIDTARLLELNFLCMHTPCDNCAHSFMQSLVKTRKPATLGAVMDMLFDIPEYAIAAREGHAPKIVAGSTTSRVQRVHVEFTGGTEGPEAVYQRLAQAGIDTIIAMHQSEEHLKKCKEHHINVIFASHIASDNVGINLMLDHLESKAEFSVYEFSGFRRVSRKK